MLYSCFYLANFKVTKLCKYFFVLLYSKFTIGNHTDDGDDTHVITSNVTLQRKLGVNTGLNNTNVYLFALITKRKATFKSG